MTNTAKISFVLENTNPVCELGTEIWMDDVCLFDLGHVTETVNFEHHLPDSDLEHCLRIVLKGKKQEHTKIDMDGTIISDARLIIKDFAFEDIPLGHTLTTKATYSHDFNGNGPCVQENFYGEMGCNGTVELKFSCPVYLWLLENL